MSSKKAKPGPSAGHVKIDMPWQKAVGKALKKKRPKEGWPTVENQIGVV